MPSKSEAPGEVTGEKTCGIVMPISGTDGYPESHWSDVLNIHSEAIQAIGLEPNLVSNAEDVGIIQKRIIQNLYSNTVVVCDVSSKNANVMLELGIRLAFDKPVVIVKDDATSYSFDTSPIEHLTYPRDLRFGKIIEFKKHLGNKIAGTIESAGKDPNFSPFLKHFGEFTVAKIDTKEVTSEQFILEELRSLRRQVSLLSPRESRWALRDSSFEYVAEITKGAQEISIDEITRPLFEYFRIDLLRSFSEGSKGLAVEFSSKTPLDLDELRYVIKSATGAKNVVVYEGKYPRGSKVS